MLVLWVLSELPLEGATCGENESEPTCRVSDVAAAPEQGRCSVVAWYGCCTTDAVVIQLRCSANDKQNVNVKNHKNHIKTHSHSYTLYSYGRILRSCDTIYIHIAHTKTCLCAGDVRRTTMSNSSCDAARKPATPEPTLAANTIRPTHVNRITAKAKPKA